MSGYLEGKGIIPLPRVSGVSVWPRSFMAALLLAACLALSMPTTAWPDTPNSTKEGDFLRVSGMITNSLGKGIEGARISLRLEGRLLELEGAPHTGRDGQFALRAEVPPGFLPSGSVYLEAARTGYRSSGQQALLKVVPYRTDSKGRSWFLAHHETVLKRDASPAVWVAGLVLLGVFLIIALDLAHRTMAVMCGAAVLLCVTYTAGLATPQWHIISLTEATKAVDFNVIFMLMGMMIVVGVLRRTGVFNWLAYGSVLAVRGNPLRLAAALFATTGMVSAFLDNVTTIILLMPVTLEMIRRLGLRPVSLIMPQIFAANIGGSSTLIGDPPNMLIGSYANLSFMDFIRHLAPVSLVILVVVTVFFLWWFRKDYRQAGLERFEDWAAQARGNRQIDDKKLLLVSLCILGMTLALLIVSGMFGIPPAVVILVGASIMLAASGANVAEVIENDIHWPTLLFFLFLFLIVAGAERTGLMQVVAEEMRRLSFNSHHIAIIVLVVVSAAASGFVDNIPFTAAMLPVVGFLGQALPGMGGGGLWWALALGTCLGGNGTLIGASANVVAIGMSERAGYPVSFSEYAKHAIIPTAIGILIAIDWLIIMQ